MDPAGQSDSLVRIERKSTRRGARLEASHRLYGVFATPPIIPGHEAAGVVVAVGKEVAGVKVGERATMNPVQYCGGCYGCTSGLEHLCINTRHLGSGGVAGTWAERVVVDARNLHKIPEGVSLTAAALSEPAAVCYQSFRRAGLRAGDTVLVLGDGPFGFFHTQLAVAQRRR